MDANQPIRINVEEVIKAKLGSRSRFIPNFLLRKVESLICQDALNDLLERNFPRRGGDFCEGVLDNLYVQTDVRGEENLPADGRFIVASNHPLGGLDGMTMIAWLSRKYGKDVHFIVNDLLMAVEPLQECFLPINKHGKQSRGSAIGIDEALAGNGPVVVYPAGLCSRLQDGVVADLEWNKMFVNKAIESQRDIIPVFFDGTNSPGFYQAASWRKRLGIKFNLEMILLPREIFRKSGSTFTLTVGEPISWKSLKGGADAKRQAAEIRALVYGLKDKYNRK